MQWEISHFDYTFVFNWAVPKRVVVGGGGISAPGSAVQQRFIHNIFLFSCCLAVFPGGKYPLNK